MIDYPGLVDLCRIRAHNLRLVLLHEWKRARLEYANCDKLSTRARDLNRHADELAEALKFDQHTEGLIDERLKPTKPVVEMSDDEVKLIYHNDPMLFAASQAIFGELERWDGGDNAAMFIMVIRCLIGFHEAMQYSNRNLLEQVRRLACEARTEQPAPKIVADWSAKK